MPFSIVNKCLTAASNADGAAVIIATCTNITTLNTWVLPQGGAVGAIRIFEDKCLDVTSGVNSDGTKLQIWTCASGNTNYRSGPQTSCGSLRAKVMPLPRPGKTSASTRRTGTSPTVTSGLTKDDLSFSLTLEKDRSLCVAVNSPQTGSPVVIKKCSPNSVFQTFDQPNPNDKIIVFGFCIAPVDQIATSGVKLVLANCEDSNAGKWNIFAGDALVKNLAFPNICLDLTSGNTTVGNQLQLWDCSALALTGAVENTNQEWIVTNYIPPRI
ncbi:hypothetical protein C8J57DRAFT_1227753 [Mycena rebaudengoi]|nr:hypothetical protein C8J57DRAFT_1227753 [Mycena rebaudengoi]